MAHFNSLLVTGDSRFLNPINGNARNGVYYVKGTQTASTGAWTGNIPVPALYDGLTIMYYLPYAGSGNATLNLTLSNGTTTGAKNCYYSTSRLTTHYAKGCNIVMTYHPAGTISVDGTATTDDRWIANASYDSDTKVRQTLLSTDTDRPLLMSYAQTSSTTGNVDNVSYRSNSIYANPSTGNVQVTTLNGYTPTGAWVGTQAQYDAIATPDPNVTYYITDGYAPPTPNAGVIGYDNTSSGLSANTVQSAVDEISTKAVTLEPKTGITIAYCSACKVGKLVSLTAEIRFSSSANTWTDLATISDAPLVYQLGVPAISTANGTLMGILQVQISGNVRIYPTSAVSNGACGFTISYQTS